MARRLTKRIGQTNSSILQPPSIHWVIFSFRNWPFTFQIMPWADREFKQNVRKALRLLRKTGRKLLQDREAQITRGELVPEDILTQICRYKGQLCITYKFVYSNIWVLLLLWLYAFVKLVKNIKHQPQLWRGLNPNYGVIRVVFCQINQTVFCFKESLLVSCSDIYFVKFNKFDKRRLH